MNKLIIILGPTGVGKTETSLSVAEYFHIPIINADSRQIYKGIPIGTAAPTPDEQKRVKHYMTEVLNIGDYYNASMFENDVLNLLNRLYEHSNIALMSGGSMMYIDAVCYGMGEIPTVSDEIRNEMKRRLSQEGLETLCQELKELDPEYYEIVDKKNYRRVVHALEIIHTTGKPFSSLLSLKEDGSVFLNSTICKCPVCGGEIRVSPKAYNCSNFSNEDVKCQFFIWRNLDGHIVTPEDVIQLCENGQVDEVLRFYRENGRPFDKQMKFQDGKIVLV